MIVSEHCRMMKWPEWVRAKATSQGSDETKVVSGWQDGTTPWVRLVGHRGRGERALRHISGMKRDLVLRQAGDL